MARKSKGQLEPVQLDEFIAATISKIVNGVVDAQRAVHMTGASVNPKAPRARATDGSVERGTGGLIQRVDFDVAVSAAKYKDEKTVLNVVGGPIGTGAAAKAAAEKANFSRISFSVDLALPPHWNIPAEKLGTLRDNQSGRITPPDPEAPDEGEETEKPAEEKGKGKK
ncbi:MAG: hypothetical protein ACYTFG_05060 [Planctomycetota bacterium]